MGFGFISGNRITDGTMNHIVATCTNINKWYGTNCFFASTIKGKKEWNFSQKS
jgi:hypothetical protein